MRTRRHRDKTLSALALLDKLSDVASVLYRAKDLFTYPFTGADMNPVPKHKKGISRWK